MEQGGWIRKMFESGIALKQQYGEENVFDLSLGNPVIEPPELFKNELRNLIQNPLKGMHRYMPNNGYFETREAIANTLTTETRVDISPNDIVMTCGAAAAINVVLKTILNPTEEVIILSPYFVEYGYYIDNHAGVAVVVPTDDNFQPDLDKIESAITPRTRAIIINSPNNPTGVVYPQEKIKSLATLLEKYQSKHNRDIYLISDEPYRRILFEKNEYTHVFPYYSNSIVVTSHAKDLALPGERIGYIAVNSSCEDREVLANGFTFCNRTLGFVNAPALMQHVVRNLQGVSVDATDYQRKRDLLYSSLEDFGYSVVKPQGAFYLFPKSPIEDDVEFVDSLQEWNVLAVPGTGFGTPGYFRISYCVEDSVIAGSLDGFKQAAEKFGL
tara:strand:- start:18248 stop:19402 length:1155 start_codon:yes stop_codon:yes gene_type:complete